MTSPSFTDLLKLRKKADADPKDQHAFEDYQFALMEWFDLPSTQAMLDNERDAERYRWLRERYSAADANYKDFGEGQAGRPVIIFDALPNWPFSFDYEKAAILLDTTIDAALEDQDHD